MTLADLANLAQIVGATVVVAGTAFAVVQVAEMTRQRREKASLSLGTTFANPEFARAWREVLDLPQGASAEVVEKSAPNSAMLVSLTIESVALMVHRRVIDIDLVWELMGGVVLASWDRLHKWADAKRIAAGDEKFDEWCQWLAERLTERYGGSRSLPAFKRFFDWKP